MDERNRVQGERTWNAQDARAHFSEVLDAALAGCPQHVTRGGRDTVVVISTEEWRRLSAEKPKMNFGEFLASFPLTHDDIDLTELRRRPSRPALFQEDD